MEDYVDAPVKDIEVLLAADLMAHRFDLPRADEPGFSRAIGRGFRGRSTSFGIGILPPGQRSPVHSADAEHLLLGLAGSIEWVVEDRVVVMQPMDLVYISAGVFYEYRNAGPDEARFVDVVGRVHSWPPRGRYEQPGGQRGAETA